VGGLVPYSNGGPGLTNGVATLKLYLGVLDPGTPAPNQVAFAAIPDLAGMPLRTAILWDAIYAPPGWEHTGPLPPAISRARLRDALGAVTAVVTIGTLGVTPEVAVTNIPRVQETVGWMIDHYRPPPFPGAIDAPLAATGAALFQQHCSKCHGTYQETPAGLRLATFPNRVIAADVIGTDPTRAQAVDAAAIAMFARTAMAPHLEAKATGGYVPVPLTSLWATAPYLHNGSVPTLYHLMHPEARPARFRVGGHRLDFEKLGIDGRLDGDGVYQYPPGYAPWMLPETYDTRLPGRGNAGHDTPFDELDEAQKQALLEFLKRV
jgi:hypothetical protein